MNTDQKRDTACTAGILGLTVGEALGVPVEFQSRANLKMAPVSDMRSGGTYGQPAGTWSDDTSLTLCLTESICDSGIEYVDQGRRFVRWLHHNEWTPHGIVFDVGMTTRFAINRLAGGIDPIDAGMTDEHTNGNGSLMRILPVALYLAFAPAETRMEIAMKCSRLTHGHPRSQLACAMFVEIAAALVRGNELCSAVVESQQLIKAKIVQTEPKELKSFEHLLSNDLASFPESRISGSGYVIDCLEASLWCALNAKSYREGVLRAVNLGDDTDTTGAVTGAMLGLHFGISSIPDEWLKPLARREDITTLCQHFQQVCNQQWKIGS